MSWQEHRASCCRKSMFLISKWKWKWLKFSGGLLPALHFWGASPPELPPPVRRHARPKKHYVALRWRRASGNSGMASLLQRTCSTVPFSAGNSRELWKMTAGTLKAAAITAELSQGLDLSLKKTFLCACHQAISAQSAEYLSTFQGLSLT